MDGLQSGLAFTVMTTMSRTDERSGNVAWLAAAAAIALLLLIPAGPYKAYLMSAGAGVMVFAAAIRHRLSYGVAAALSASTVAALAGIAVIARSLAATI